MIFKYTQIGLHPTLGAIYRPQLPVRFHNKEFGFKALAVVDSGAYLTILNKAYANRLGLLWNKGIKAEVLGIVGGLQYLYIYDIEFEVVGLKDSRRKIKVGFVDLDNVDILLGQLGFFEHFHVEFNHSNREFGVGVP